MGQRSIQEDFETQFNDVISRLQSKQLFQSEWDIGFVVIFLVFIDPESKNPSTELSGTRKCGGGPKCRRRTRQGGRGLIGLLVLLVLIRCCCCCCCDEKPKRHKVGIENMSLEP
ncbi:small integral membrane protein 22 isoform X1 [Festucalex cinctus]